MESVLLIIIERMELLEYTGISTNFVLDKTGKIIKTNIEIEELEQQLKKLN